MQQAKSGSKNQVLPDQQKSAADAAFDEQVSLELNSRARADMLSTNPRPIAELFRRGGDRGWTWRFTPERVGTFLVEFKRGFIDPDSKHQELPGAPDTVTLEVLVQPITASDTVKQFAAVAAIVWAPCWRSSGSWPR